MYCLGNIDHSNNNSLYIRFFKCRIYLDLHASVPTFTYQQHDIEEILCSFLCACLTCYICIFLSFQTKTGPFSEHSSTLYSIKNVPHWEKVFSGCLKMYKAEVSALLLLADKAEFQKSSNPCIRIVCAIFSSTHRQCTFVWIRCVLPYSPQGNFDGSKTSAKSNYVSITSQSTL